MKGPISVISSFSDDMLLDEAGNYLGIKPGGPALFITRALKNEDVDFNLFCSDKLVTEIKLMDDNEFGRLKFFPKSRNAGELSLDGWTIISTISDEWDISRIQNVDYLFLDVQGYVREGHSFGKKKIWPQITEFADGIYGLKGTAEEIACLPRPFVEDQKKKLLVITLGKDGAEIYWQGKKHTVEAEQIESLTDTIGAGDTFFTYFVLGLYRGLDPRQAAREASRKTADFLREEK